MSGISVGVSPCSNKKRGYTPASLDYRARVGLVVLPPSLEFFGIWIPRQFEYRYQFSPSGWVSNLDWIRLRRYYTKLCTFSSAPFVR